MKTLKQLIESKNKKLASVAPEQSVLRALEIMAEHDVGALLVLDGKRLAGVFSERDYARKVILQGKASKSTKVSEIMSGKVVYVTLNRTIEECMAIMTEKHFRHLPVLDDDHNVVGIVSIGDMIKEMISQQKFIIDQLENDLTGGSGGHGGDCCGFRARMNEAGRRSVVEARLQEARGVVQVAVDLAAVQRRNEFPPVKIRLGQTKTIESPGLASLFTQDEGADL